VAPPTWPKRRSSSEAGRSRWPSVAPARESPGERDRPAAPAGTSPLGHLPRPGRDHRRARPGHEGLDPRQHVGRRDDRDPGRLDLVLTQNAGALFGLFQDNALLFGLISTVVIGAIVVFHARSAASRATSIALGLLLGGALGNLIDRFRLGYVVDFVDIGIGDVFRWYTFNVADAAISAAIVSLIVLAIWPGVGESIDHLGTPAGAAGSAGNAESSGPAGRAIDG
jgi:signal peptidase II